MTRSKIVLVAAAAVAILGSGLAYAGYSGERMPVEFYAGHWHDEHGDAVNAPAHSGGTDAFGCHNGSVPYHCH